MKRSLQRALELHSGAANQLLEVVEAIPDSRWKEPIREEKWSPAELVEHLNCSYDVLLDELAGGPGMEIRVPMFTRLVLRWTVFPKIMRTGVFPEGARAPKETRPTAPAPMEKADAIEAFRLRMRRFDETTRAAGPNQRLTHAYFGPSSVASGVKLCARHIQHHCAQLPRARD